MPTPINRGAINRVILGHIAALRKRGVYTVRPGYKFTGGWITDAGVKPTPRAWTWAALMHRAFAIDVLACAHCEGRLRLIATLHDPAVIRKILVHLALSRSGQSPGPAPPDSGAAASCSDRLGGAADAVVPAPRGGIAADSAGPPAD